MKDRQDMNTERVACFGKEESYWNDLLIQRDGFISRLLMEQQVKTVDRTIRYRHQHRCNWPRRRQRRGARRRRCGRRRRKRSIRYPKQNNFNEAAR